MSGKIYLFPVPIAETPIEHVLPAYNRDCLAGIRHFIVEDIRTARRFLKKVDPQFEVDACSFYLLNKHTAATELNQYLTRIKEGFDMGILSESGCPAIADPGADIVRMAQEMDVEVIPLVGPSSILLALMASGFNGQRFCFEGYLPVDKDQRAKSLKQLEQRSYQEDMSLLFIETPYRNQKMLEDLLLHLRPQTRVGFAYDVTGPDAWIKSKSVAEWKKHRPTLDKKPCIFMLYKG
ncbi:MAG: SAM-dependent methyltransferase [Bacteroidales bacterium]|jgi:16S rRNA (cytidine1402-2'-O)-methyltransferase|nr:SAM-dependent methyltransferase [Bacteroidales bacterium]HKL92857.1 SAM-dependent methyltransferase [Bacteroidales bacterium]